MSAARILEINNPISPLANEFTTDTVLVPQGLLGAEVIALVHGSQLRHLVQKDCICYEAELNLARLMIETPQLFLNEPIDIIRGVERKSENEFQYLCTAIENKKQLLLKLGEFLDRHLKTKGVRDDALMAADEIFSNASKNSGHFYAKLQPASLASPARSGEIVFEAYLDSERLILVCSDSFGLLDPMHLISKIHGCYQKGVAGAIQDGTGGAGIGSFMIFNTCSQFYLAVEKGVRTVVACSFQVSPRTKDKTAIPKNIHIVSI